MTTSAPIALNAFLFASEVVVANTASAECLGKLHRDQTDRGRRADNEHAVARREPCLRDERVVLGGQPDRQGGGVAP